MVCDIPVKSFITINSEISVLKSKVGGFRLWLPAKKEQVKFQIYRFQGMLAVKDSPYPPQADFFQKTFSCLFINNFSYTIKF